MTTVLLGIGSNHDRERHLARGLDALEQLLGRLELSPVFESESVGMLGRRFYNMVVGTQTHLPLADLQAALKAIEAACGRRETKAPGRVTLDIDILVYGTLTGVHDGILLPRRETARNAFVLWPLALLAPDSVLPGTAQRYAELWAGWQGDQSLWPVHFEWHGRALTPDELIEAHRPSRAL
ncbi:2-amino-4-hydroxy-6-hydroxymethyldihydropteridine diphosphokinase [Pseudomonas sp. gcc21]|uniref:2-amino-4-hydroxy-6- hydroxymethyldihydropteridine diphosphokinase n=1 Tax=Pseudomonas sp. gcc21 TaxID=2726989 RepID=UPI001451513B|nr:2-amino-4-hydroxy-6-hydroxymethyldihydropteridine diphosphokinase [Pseudomonas sp. gcc21]QJD59414.1 2-amino-4-hydroxy-6-hydroxymethyldihydropteridine diphosphokinase [Pseudomonas sp. gcc21]